MSGFDVEPPDLRIYAAKLQLPYDGAAAAKT